MADQSFTKKEIPVSRFFHNASCAISFVFQLRLAILLALLVQGNLSYVNAANTLTDLSPSTGGIPSFGWFIGGNDGLNTEAASMVSPNITVRFANPHFDCLTNEYCLDVEFQSDLPGQELFGMNVRFFYQESILELINFRDFQGGYGPIVPNPPTVQTSPAAFGYNYFGFGTPGNGAADFVNGAIQLTNENLPPIYLSTTGWTKLFQICFAIDDPNPDSLQFCPSIVWDLEQNPANGGYLTGDDGVVMTVATGAPGVSEPSFEHVSQFNWMYTGSGSAPPYGQPIETSCIALSIDASIDASTAAGCYYTNRIFQPVQPEIPGAVYHWDFGYRAVPAEADGYGPFSVYYDTAGTKSVSLIVYPYEDGEACGDSSSITFLINACPANIVGNVKSTLNEPIPGVNIRLYADVDSNGIADNATLIRSVFTNSLGDFAMASLLPGHYVMKQTQPSGWNSFDDGDTSPDNDAVPNIDPLDNLIPVTLKAGEIDMGNYFIETGAPGSIAGTVFNDFDFDQFPDSNEGLENVEVNLFADIDANGIADSNFPELIEFTNGAGNYTFTNVVAGNYVIVETNPDGYQSVLDVDASNDSDVVPNTNIMNDTLPVTVGNGESDAQNYFMDVLDCSLLVTNLNDAGPGSFREAIVCAETGDTIRFLSSLEGLTITINSARILLDKSIHILSDCEPRIVIKSEISGLFDIVASVQVEFKHLNITSGHAGNAGAAFNNYGWLTLEDVIVLRNPLLPPGEYLIRNGLSSQLLLKGNCFLEMN